MALQQPTGSTGGRRQPGRCRARSQVGPARQDRPDPPPDLAPKKNTTRPFPPNRLTVHRPTLDIHRRTRSTPRSSVTPPSSVTGPTEGTMPPSQSRTLALTHPATEAPSTTPRDPSGERTSAAATRTDAAGAGRTDPSPTGDATDGADREGAPATEGTTAAAVGPIPPGPRAGRTARVSTRRNPRGRAAARASPWAAAGARLRAAPSKAASARPSRRRWSRTNLESATAS